MSVDEGSKKERTHKSRDLYERAYQLLKSTNKKEERMILLEAWKSMETEFGTPSDIKLVDDKMPRVVKKRRKVDGGIWEEYFDYIFPDDEMDKPNFKLLAMAQEWKLKNAAIMKEKDIEIANQDAADEMRLDAEMAEFDDDDDDDDDDDKVIQNEDKENVDVDVDLDVEAGFGVDE